MIPKRHRMKVGAVALAVLLGAGYAVAEHGGAGTPAPASTATAGGPAPAVSGRPAAGGKRISLGDALSMLWVAPPLPSEGYDREKFDLYVDADGDGCDARREVLIEEAVHAPKVEQPGCKLIGGAWYSPYDGKTVRDADDMTIDHMVPLHEAWISGAREWPHERLVAYGNYLADPGHLVAVTGASNSDKSDKDPAYWLPPHTGRDDTYTCRYLADWVGVKIRWGLTVDEEEVSVLQQWGDAKTGKCRLEPVLIPGDASPKKTR